MAIAHFNVARLLHPPGDPRVAEFTSNTVRVNLVAERSPRLALERTGIEWCDSCAAADHPMIDRIWRERRAIGRLSIGIGGTLRQRLFRAVVGAELGRNPAGLRR